MHPKLKWKLAFIKIKVICLLLDKSYTFASNNHYFDINSTVRNDFSNLFVVMYERVNKKGQNKKCNNRVAWSVQQLRKREEIKWGIRVFEVAFQFTK